MPRYGVSEVVQPGFWDYAGYIYDTVSPVGILATIIATIATLAGAAGLGWLAPLFIPLVGGFVQGCLTIEGEGKAQNLTGDSKKEKYLGLITNFVNGFASAVGIMIGTGAVTAAIATTVIVSVIMVVLEVLRVQLLDRKTIYGVVFKAITACCRSGEQQQLLPSNN